MRAQAQFSGASVSLLETIDPAAPLDDLEPLARMIGDEVRLVAIGESVHAAHEFYALRHRFIRFLVERMNFTAVVWESGFPEGFLVDAYIQGQPHDRERVQTDGITMHLGRCQEMGDLLDWLREHNASSASPVRFYGLDLPGSSASLQSVLEVVVPYVESVDPSFGGRLSRLREFAAANGLGTAEPSNLGKLEIAGTKVVQRYQAMSVADRNELTALLADMSARFDSLRRTYVERSDAERYDVARQHLRVAARLDLQLRAVVALMSGDASACEGNIRDATMADTVEWILHRHGRIIIAAHNGHIQKTPITTPTGTVGSVDTVGVHLAERFGERYVAIGTTCGGGEMVGMRTTAAADGSYESEFYLRDLPPREADTVDSLLDSSCGGIGLLDLRSLDAQSAAAIDAARRMRMQDQLMEIDVRRAFDMLIHVPRISVWKSDVIASLPDERGSSKQS
jgi:erythromycin esterase